MKHYVLSFNGKTYDLNSIDFEEFVLHRLKLNAFQMFQLLTKKQTFCGGSILSLVSETEATWAKDTKKPLANS